MMAGQHPFYLCNRDASYLLSLARATGHPGCFALRYAPLARGWTVTIGNHVLGDGKSPDEAMQAAGDHLLALRAKP